MRRVGSVHALVACEFMRAVRGRRSQVAFSRRLGFASNVAAEWESGRRIPPVLTAFKACQRLGVDALGALRAFRPSTAALLRRWDADSLSEWLEAQRGEEALGPIARRAGLSRHQVSRFLAGRSEPRLHQFFALLEACSGRLGDFVAACVDIQQIEQLRVEHARRATLQRLALAEPWTSAIASALECYTELSPRAASRVLARQLGLEEARVAQYLSEMQQADVIREQAGRYVLGQPLVVDTAARSEAARRLARHWAEVGAARATAPHEGDIFSYNVFSVSRSDLERIAALQREHFQRVRAIVGESQPETLAVMNLQLLAFEPSK